MVALVGSLLLLLVAQRAELPTVEDLQDAERWRKSLQLYSPVLKYDVILMMYTKPVRIKPPPSVIAILPIGGEPIVAKSVSDVRPHVVSIDTIERAKDFTDLLRRLDTIDTSVVFGQVLVHDKQQDQRSPGVRGGFTEHDSKRWGIPLVDTPTATDESIVLVRPMYVRNTDPDAAMIALVRETIGRSGSYTAEIERVLEKGRTCLRFRNAIH